MDIQTLIEGNIVDLLGLQNLQEKEKTELLTQLGEVVQERMTDRILESLSEEDRAKFDDLLEKNASEADINAFLQSTVKNLDQMVTEEMLVLKAQMVDDATTLRKIAAAQA